MVGAFGWGMSPLRLLLLFFLVVVCMRGTGSTRQEVGGRPSNRAARVAACVHGKSRSHAHWGAEAPPPAPPSLRRGGTIQSKPKQETHPEETTNTPRPGQQIGPPRRNKQTLPGPPPAAGTKAPTAAAAGRLRAPESHPLRGLGWAGRRAGPPPAPLPGSARGWCPRLQGRRRQRSINTCMNE